MTRRVPSPDFDPRIADWLESDPNDAPDLVLETVLAAFPSIPQRRASRAPWRFVSMNRLALLGAAAVIAVALISGFLLSSRPQANIGASASSSPGASSAVAPSLGASSSASSLALNQTFTSPRYGYSVDYPAEWAVTPAMRDWATGKRTLWGDPALDTLAGTDARFVAASQPLADGKTADDWYTDYCVVNGGSSADCGSATTRWQPIQIGTAPGYLDTNGEPAPPNGIAAGGIVFDGVVVIGARGYEFTLDGLVDRATFDRFIAGVKIVSVPALDATFTSARHGASIRYPTGWTVTPASKPWASGDAPSPPNPSLDILADPADVSRSFVLVSQRLPIGTTPAAWLAGYARSAPQMPAACWPSPDSMEQTTVDGQTAWIHGGVPGCGFTEAIVFAAGRVYELTAYGPTNAVPYPRPLFDSLLSTVKLDPAAANDRP